MYSWTKIRMVPIWNQLLLHCWTHVTLLLFREAEQVGDAVTVWKVDVLRSELVEEWRGHSLVEAKSFVGVVV